MEREYELIVEIPLGDAAVVAGHYWTAVEVALNLIEGVTVYSWGFPKWDGESECWIMDPALALKVNPDDDLDEQRKLNRLQQLLSRVGMRLVSAQEWVMPYAPA